MPKEFVVALLDTLDAAHGAQHAHSPSVTSSAWGVERKLVAQRSDL